MAGDRQAADRGQLVELVGLVDDVFTLPSSGPRAKYVTPRQSKRVRAEAVTGLWELGRAHVVGWLPLLEQEAQSWNPDGDGKSPNRVDVMAHLLTHLDHGRGAAVRVSSPSGADARVPSRLGAQRIPARSGARPSFPFTVVDGGVPTRSGAVDRPRRPRAGGGAA